MGSIKSLLIGIGSYVPEFVLTNEMLEKLVDTSDEWIVKRTGIRERRIAMGMHTWELGAKAAQAALDDAGISAEEVDLILLSTCSPDTFSPPTACSLQAEIGAVNAAAVDINACCTGFIYASDMADCYIKAGKAKTVLVVAAETLHRVTDYTDRSVCCLLGDGAGAAIYRATEDAEAGDRGILSSHISADGTGAEYLYMEALPIEENPFDGDRTYSEKNRFLKMNGSQVVRFTAREVPATMEKAIERAGLTAADIDWVVPHQANLRILQIIEQRFNLPTEKLYVNIDRFGNTSSASIPLCLDEMKKKGLLAKGQNIVCAGFGGGLTFGSFVVRL